MLDRRFIDCLSVLAFTRLLEVVGGDDRAWVLGVIVVPAADRSLQHLPDVPGAVRCIDDIPTTYV